MIKLAEEMSLEISFDNPPDKVGCWVGDTKFSYDEIFAPFLTIKEDEDAS